MCRNASIFFSYVWVFLSYCVKSSMEEEEKSRGRRRDGDEGGEGVIVKKEEEEEKAASGILPYSLKMLQIRFMFVMSG